MPGELEKVERISERLMRRVIAVGGTLCLPASAAAADIHAPAAVHRLNRW